MSTTSLVSDAEKKQLLETIRNLYSSDNNTRKTADRFFNDQWLQPRPHHLAATLAEFCQKAILADDSLRAICCVLLRRISFKQHVVLSISSSGSGILWHHLADDVKRSISATLIQALHTESSASVCSKLADALSEIARLKSGDWPELMDICVSCVSGAADYRLLYPTLRMIATYPLIIQPMTPVNARGYFSQALSIAKEDSVVLEAIRAITSFVSSTDAATRMVLNPMMPQVFSALERLLEKHSDQAEEALFSIVDLAQQAPNLAKQNLSRLFGMLVPILGTLPETSEASEGVRLAALELFVTLCEELPKTSRRFLREDARLLNSLFEVLLPSIPDDSPSDVWYTRETLDGDDDEDGWELYDAAISAIDRCSQALGGSAILPVAFNVIPKFLASSSWKHRYVALMAIAFLAEGCVDVLEERLEELLRPIFHSFNDQHIRVRHAAIHALGQLCTDFGSLIQQRYHSATIPALLSAMSDSQHPRVQCHAISALINFTDCGEAGPILPYLAAVVQRLLQLIQSRKIYLQEQAVTTLCCIAELVGSEMASYFDAIMPLLMQVLTHASVPAYRSLAAKTIDAATAIGVAVGSERFCPNFYVPITDLMFAIQQSNLSSDDPMLIYLPASWIRICQLQPASFTRFLPVILTSILNSASKDPEIAILEADEELTPEQKSADWNFSTIHGKRLGIKTSMLEEKLEALRCLNQYVTCLGGAFAPFAESCLKIVLPLLDFEYDDTIVAVAISLILPLLRSRWMAIGADSSAKERFLRETWHPILAKLLSSIEARRSLQSEDAELLAELLASVGSAVECFSTQIAPDLGEFLKAIATHFREIFEEFDNLLRRLKSKSSLHPDQEGTVSSDANDDELDMELEENVLWECSRFLRSALTCHDPAMVCLAFSDALARLFAAFTQHPQSNATRHLLFCIFDDIVEFAPSNASIQAVHRWLQPIFEFLSQPAQTILGEPDLMQAAVYGVGMCAIKGGEPYRAFCLACVSPMLAIAESPKARSEDCAAATENAVSAVAKCWSAFHAGPNGEAQLRWLKCLPITHDDQEMAPAYRYAISLVADRNFAATYAVPVAKIFLHLTSNEWRSAYCSSTNTVHQQLFHDAQLAFRQLSTYFSPESGQFDRIIAEARQ